MSLRFCTLNSPPDLHCDVVSGKLRYGFCLLCRGPTHAVREQHPYSG